MKNTRDSILEVSLKLFAQEGYEAVSVSKIAAELGITKGALYKHYESKRDIFNCIIGRLENDDRIASETYSMPDDKSSASVNYKQLVAFALNQFHYWTEDEFAGNFRRLLTIEQYRSDEMQALYQRHLCHGQLSYVADIFSHMGVANYNEKALEFFAPMFLCYNLYDSGEDIELLHKRLENHFNNFRL